MWLSLAIAIFVALPLAGIMLLILGLRGPRLDTLPRCSRCRFETTGLAATAPCPECGVDLSLPKAITIGRRRKRPLAIGLGTLLLLVPIAIFATAAAIGVNNPANNPGKPNWLLQLETHRTDARLAAAAITELARRIGTPAMSDNTAKALLDRALLAQVDPLTPWLPEWADLILACRRAGLCDDQSYARFVRQGISLTWTTRPIVRAGRHIPATLSVSGSRLGTQVVNVRIEHESLFYNDEPMPPGSGSAVSGVSASGTNGFGTGLPAVDQPGQLTIKKLYRIRLADHNLVTTDQSFSWTESFISTARVVDADAVVIETDATIAPETMLADLKITSIQLDPLSKILSYLGPTVQSNGRLPVALVGTVHAIWTGPDGIETETNVGSVALHATSAGGYGTLGEVAFPPGFTPTHARIVIRPDAETAENTVNITRIYAGPELVFENVPITDSRTKPGTP